VSGVLVHEWIGETGGAERVIESLARAFPGADLECLWSDVAAPCPGHEVTESWLARTPLRHHKAMAMPFMLAAWRRRSARKDYEWILASSHLFAHHVRFAGAAASIPKLAYIHSPARYLWAPELDRRGSNGWYKAAGVPFKLLDKRRSAETVAFAANSHYVKERIASAWDREAQVIYPPVDVERISSVTDWTLHLSDDDARVMAALPDDFVLGASRMVGYKRMDQVITAGRLMQLPVVLAGSGPLEMQLLEQAASAGVPVHFVGRVSDELLYALYQRALLFVFPPVEDFGIIPVEAMAAGARVLANRTGGTAETVLDGVTGALADFEDLGDLAAAIQRADSSSVSKARMHALKFSEARFHAEVQAWVGSVTGSEGCSGRTAAHSAQVPA
jgi:glycosyltransferase involved in cell wall biosynthesis